VIRVGGAADPMDASVPHVRDWLGDRRQGPLDNVESLDARLPDG
jgi:hypothetical protein